MTRIRRSEPPAAARSSRRAGARAAAGAAACLALLLPAGAGRAQIAFKPTGDVREGFAADARLKPAWALGGSWGWDSRRTALVSSPPAGGTAFWKPGLSYTGTLTARLLLAYGRSGAAPRARLVFARDPQSGAFRYVQVQAGSPGRVLLGQTGTIRGSAGRTVGSVLLDVPRNAWITLAVRVAGDGTVTASLGGRQVLSAAAGPLAPGQVGFSSVASRVLFGAFAFRADPDGEPCRDCHASAPAVAPDVFRYWDGSANGGQVRQRGGHGDPGGLPATSCAGSTGCHDLRLPAAGEHRNGVLERWSYTSPNPNHLRAGFIADRPVNPWDVQLTFDNYCATACHQGQGIHDMRHLGVTTGRPYLQLGTGSTVAGGPGFPPDYPLDRDISAAAAAGMPRFATCVTCHDPHGTGVPDEGRPSNRMIREMYRTASTLCAICHI